jgi:predicted RNA-binding Zn-ribbon protein involved in translation (DUF1610 family)
MTMTTSDVPPATTTPLRCPQCMGAMRIRTVVPVMSVDELDDITYRCDDCGIEATSTVKR